MTVGKGNAVIIDFIEAHVCSQAKLRHSRISSFVPKDGDQFIVLLFSSRFSSNSAPRECLSFIVVFRRSCIASALTSEMVTPGSATNTAQWHKGIFPSDVSASGPNHCEMERGRAKINTLRELHLNINSDPGLNCQFLFIRAGCDSLKV